MFHPTDISRLRQAVATYAKAFDADVITTVDAVVVIDEAARIEKMAATLKALAGARAADATVLERDGDLSPAHALARRTGTTVGKAADALRTAKRLRSQPALDAAARSGDVSPEQAAAISDASAANPAAETRLVEKSRQASLAELRNECEREKAAADRDAEERHKRIHAARYARRRSCPDGSAEITYRSTRDDVAQAWAVITGFANEAFNRARRAGRRESSEAYAADGVLDMARAAAGVPAPESDKTESPETTRGFYDDKAGSPEAAGEAEAVATSGGEPAPSPGASRPDAPNGAGSGSPATNGDADGADALEHEEAAEPANGVLVPPARQPRPEAWRGANPPRPGDLGSLVRPGQI